MLPRKCECGGVLTYTRDFGRVSSFCLACTPVEDMVIPNERVQPMATVKVDPTYSLPEDLRQSGMEIRDGFVGRISRKDRARLSTLLENAANAINGATGKLHRVGKPTI